MLPPLYLADTCSLRDAQMRAYWESKFFTQPGCKLTVLSTVHYELERQKLLPKHREEAKAALAFLNKHQSQVILLPEQAEIPKGSVADREIFYHCALQQNREVVLFTADDRLRQAVLLINPLVQVQRLIKGQLKCEPSRWLSVYRRLAEQYCLYVTAACINSAAFAALMRSPEIASLFRGKLRLSTASLPLLKAQGKELLKTLEAQGLAPLLVPQACFDVTETAELTARLLTHCGRKPALVLLADGDNLSDYAELSRIPLAALDHKGYSIGVLKGNGRISVQTDPTETPEPAEEETPELAESESVAEVPAETAAVEEPQTSEEQESPAVQAEEMPELPAASEADEVGSLTNAQKKQCLTEWVEAGDVKKAGALLETNRGLIAHAVQTCFDGHMEKLLPLLNSLSQRKLRVPASSLNHYLTSRLLKEGSSPAEHLNDDEEQKVVRRMVKMALVPTDGYAAAIQMLEDLKGQREGKELARVQNLIDVAAACAAAADVSVAAPEASAEGVRADVAVPPAVNAKELVRQGVLAEKTTKVGAMISGNESLIRHAINTCFKEKRAMLGSIVQSLSQRKNHLPPKCFAAFVGTYMPTKPAELNRYFNDKPFVSAVKRMIGLCTSLKDCQTAMDTLQKRIAETDGATQKVLKTLMDSAIANGAPRPQREN